MRTLCLPVILLGMSSFIFAQGEPGAPCCNVIAVDAKTNLVTARDKTSGRLYQFQADKLDIQSIQKDDEVNISRDRVTSVKGAQRSYGHLKIAYGAPCCQVVAIEPNAGAPCCSMVSYGNPGTNQLYSILVPKHVANTIKVGDPVFAEPAGAEPAGAEPAGSVMSGSNAATSAQPAKGLAVLFANAGDGMHAYGYPVQSGNSGGKSEEKWTTRANNQKGVTGRLVFANMPKDAAWQIDVYREPDNKSIVSLYSTGGLTNYTLSPGAYTMKLSSMPVEHVPVKQGHDTELKFGLLNVVSGGTWMVLNGKTTLFTRYKPAKIVLPPGTYKLNLGGADYSVVIEEGKTVEY